MKILKDQKTVVEEAVLVIKNGGLVVFPTETMYGIGADATSPEAILKLVEYKKRPFGKPFSIAVTSQKMAEEFVELNDTAKKLYKSFLPGPVTIISSVKKTSKLAPGVASEIGTLGIRIPDYPLVNFIVEKLGRPITATSANASYQKRPYKVADILDNISIKQRNLIDLIIDVGVLPTREPSTVIDTTLDDIVTIRQGDLVIGEENSVISKSEEATRNVGKELWQKYVGNRGQRAMVFALTGEMGTGKTQFTKGLALAMGIEEEILSPTFSLENRYNEKNFSHIDAWRMQDSTELASMEFSSLIKNKAVVAIEWADRVMDEIKKFDEEAIIVMVNIEYKEEENERKIKWRALN